MGEPCALGPQHRIAVRAQCNEHQADEEGGFRKEVAGGAKPLPGHRWEAGLLDMGKWLPYF